MFSELFFQQLFLLIVSTIANFLSAFSGGGAGLIQLPVLILFGLPFPVALATHKLASVALGIGAGVRHFKEKNLSPKLTFIILFFGIPGVYIGSNLALSVPNNIASCVLGVLTLSLGLYSSNKPDLGITNKVYKDTFYNNIVGGFVLFIIGILNGSLSSGTGLFVTLWIVRWFSLPYSRALGFTLILVGFVWNGTGALIVGTQSDVMWDWLVVLIIGSLLGGYLGAHLSIVKGNTIVKKSFEIICIIMGSLLIAKAIE